MCRTQTVHDASSCRSWLNTQLNMIIEKRVQFNWSQTVFCSFELVIFRAAMINRRVRLRGQHEFVDMKIDASISRVVVMLT